MAKRIEICGCIAAGKTSLAKSLEEKGLGVVYERFEDNPFLKEFYCNNAGSNTLETEIVFTLLHYNMIKERKDKLLICDYSLFQDYCYGINNLCPEEMEVFKALFDYLMKKVAAPDIIIYLKCNVDVLLERIEKRNREMEQGITRQYLQENINILERYLHGWNNVLVIESDKYNFIEKDKMYIVEKILRHCKYKNLL